MKSEYSREKSKFPRVQTTQMKSQDEQFGSSVLSPTDGEAGEWAIGTLSCAAGASAPRGEIIPLSNSPSKR